MDQAYLENAARQTARAFQRPEQLDRVGDLVVQYRRKKTNEDTRLKTIVQAQLEDFQTGHDLIQTSHIASVHLVDTLQKIRVTLDKSKELFPDYDQLRHVAEAREQLYSTAEGLDTLYSAREVAEELKEQLEEPDVNMLEIHQRLRNLEACRNDMLDYTKDLPSERRTLLWYFEAVEEVRSILDQRLWDTISMMMEIGEEDCPVTATMLVSVMRIIEREEIIDTYVEQSPQLKDSGIARDRPRKYKAKCMEAVQNMIHERFQEQYSEFPSVFTHNMEQFIVKDIIKGYITIGNSFPPTYRIARVLLESYHLQVYQMLDAMCTDVANMDSAACVALLNFENWYYGELKTRFRKERQNFNLEILDLHKSDLVERYVELADEKTEEWLGSLLSNEFSEWFNQPYRDTPPEEDTNGYYMTSFPVILFQILNQQIGLAVDTKTPALLIGVVKMAVKKVRDLTGDLQKRLSYTMYRHYELPPEDKFPFLVEYLMAAMNNLQKCITHFGEMTGDVLESLPDVDRAEIRDISSSVEKELNKAIQSTASQLLSIIMTDLQPFLGELFGKAWLHHQKDPMKVIITTLEDYGGDIVTHVDPLVHPVVFDELNYRISAAYVDALFNSKNQLGGDVAGPMIQREIDDLDLYFDEIIDVFSDQMDKLNYRRLMMRAVLDVFSTSNEMLMLNFGNAKRTDPDFSIDHALTLVKLRNDMPKALQKDCKYQLRSQRMRRTDRTRLPAKCGRSILPRPEKHDQKKSPLKKFPGIK
eukprot:Clim_evm36s202 gene=Clim_evmTU36s202